MFCRDTPPPPPPPPGPQTGCTPGYWKQTQHFDSWATPILPATSFEAVFGNIPGADVSFLQALQGGGGSDLEGALRILRRAAAAAYLNALLADDVLNFGYPPELIVAYVNQVANTQNRDAILVARRDARRAQQPELPAELSGTSLDSLDAVRRIPSRRAALSCTPASRGGRRASPPRWRRLPRCASSATLPWPSPSHSPPSPGPVR